MIKNFATIIALFAVGLVFAACEKDFNIEENREGRLLVSLAFDDYKDIEVKSIGTIEERQVNTIDVMFFNAAGNKIKFPGLQKYAMLYDVVNDDNSKWKNQDKSTNTVVLPILAENALSKTIIVIANLPQSLRTRLEEDDVQTVTQIKALFAQQNAIDDLGTPLVMFAEKQVTAVDIPNPDQENTIRVLMERAVAKVDIILHYEWNKLVPDNEFQRGYYTMKDFSGTTYLSPQTTLKNIIKRIERPRTIIQRTTLPVPQATTKITAYINEYDLEDPYVNTTSVTSPYIMLELPAILGKDFAKSIGIFPPPAGGEEEFNTTPITNFYRLVMPRKIVRNYHYTIHAVIFGAGAPTAEGAQLLTFNFTVVPWEK
ncbi:hypothetical protein EII14_02635 [Alloprevotella sp. OH1205_COT-284]|uniref:hypothetical protein n=1 Tax=Alloprevotella sp. OH1205_COT-284 TaxID=2491043 RepID=UPI000F5F9863|nr:hypothetical protein [Alloprevotella sp. OH1205_COT-284]RRD80379.1 hypothetical protein EII14_02635 [Alloprevotella sp. OH1205_COT-284]